LAAIDGVVYGSTALPNKLFRIVNGAIQEIEELGNGECYSIIPFQGLVYIGAYASDAQGFIYNGSTFRSFRGPLQTWRPKVALVRAGDVVFGGFYTGVGVMSRLTQAGLFDIAVPLTASPEAYAKEGDLFYVGTSVTSQGTDTNVTADVTAKVYCLDQDLAAVWTTTLPTSTRISNIWVTPTELWCLATAPSAGVVVLDKATGAFKQRTTVSLAVNVIGRNRNALVDYKGTPLFPASEGLYRLERDGVVQVAPLPAPYIPTPFSINYAPGGSAVVDDRLYVAWGPTIWEYTDNIKS
jgi:hypothetical protein